VLAIAAIAVALAGQSRSLTPPEVTKSMVDA